jgi:hypothetical protein
MLPVFLDRGENLVDGFALLDGSFVLSCSDARPISHALNFRGAAISFWTCLRNSAEAPISNRRAEFVDFLARGDERLMGQGKERNAVRCASANEVSAGESRQKFGS